MHSYPFEPRILPYWHGTRIIYKRDVLIVKISTDEGLVGFAEGAPYPYDQYLLLKNSLAPVVLGESPFDTRGVWQTAAKVIPEPEALNLAMAPVDMALHDIIGKATGKTVSDLLGGRKRSTIRLYASAGMYQSPQGYAEEALRFVEHGFRAYKYRPGIGVQRDIETVRAVRDAVGDDVEIMVDAAVWSGRKNYHYSPSSVRQIAKEYERASVYFLEEPFSQEDQILFKDLKVATPALPLAAGESETTISGFERLLHVVDILQPDPAICGGFTLCKKVAEIAKSHNRRLVAHCWGTRLLTMAEAQLWTSLSEDAAPWMEYPVYATDRIKSMYPNKLAEEILSEPLDIDKGELRVSEKPGVGAEVNEAVLTRYPFIPGRWSLDIPHSGFPP